MSQPPYYGGQPAPQGPGASAGVPQPGYGAPPPPPPQPSSHPSQPPRSPRSSGDRRLSKAVVIGSVLALLAAGTAGLVLFLGGSGEGGGSGKNSDRVEAGDLVWQTESRTTPMGSAKSAPGTWFTDTAVIKAEPDMVTSYDLRTGKKQWAFLLDGTLCAASRDVDGDRVLVSYELHGACVGLTAVDIRNGDRVWSLSLIDVVREQADSELKPDTWKWPLQVAVSNGHGLVSWGTGERLVRLSDGETVSEEKRKKRCDVVRAAGGAQLVTANLCDGQYTVESLDVDAPDKPKWTWRTGDIYVQSIVSSDPAVIVTGENPHETAELIVFGDNGKERSRIDVSVGGEARSCRRLTSPDCTSFLVTGERVYGASKGATTAYDITTGERAWVNQTDTDRLGVPVAVDGEELVTYVAATVARPGRHSRVSVETGKTLRTTRHDQRFSRAEWELADSGEAVPYLSGNRFLLVQEGLVGDEDDDIIFAVAD